MRLGRLPAQTFKLQSAPVEAYLPAASRRPFLNPEQPIRQCLELGMCGMDEEEYNKKYVYLAVLKSAQEYLKEKSPPSTALHPISVPHDLLYQVLRFQGAEKADKLIHYIFKLGLTLWSEQLYVDVFGSQESLEDFIELVKQRNRK